MNEPIIQTVPQDPLPTRHQTPWWKFAIGFLVIVALGIIVDAIWVQYFSPAAQDTQQMEEQYAAYEQQQKEYEEAIQQDTYGGKTPEETLALFIDALEKEDLDLASKYFLIETNLNNQKWIDFLTKIKNEGNIQRFAEDLKGAKKGNSLDNKDSGFVLLNPDGTVGIQIDMQLNNQTNIWKIESL